MKPYPTLLNKLMLFSLCCFFIGLSSCGIQKDIDSLNFSKPIKSAEPAADELASGVAKSAMAGLDTGAQKTLNDLIKAIDIDKLNPDIQKLLLAIKTIGDTTSLQVTKIGNTVHWQIGQLNGDVKIMGKTLGQIVDSLKNDTKDVLSNIILNALNSLQSPASKAKIDSIVSSLLDQNTRAKAQLLVSSALQPTIDSLAGKINGVVRGDLPFVQKEAVGLLVALGVIALVIIAFVWYERSKYARLLKIVTYQIDKMPEEHQAAYDDLTHKIKDHAQNDSLQPLLANVLKAQGIN